MKCWVGFLFVSQKYLILLISRGLMLIFRYIDRDSLTDET